MNNVKDTNAVKGGISQQIAANKHLLSLTVDTKQIFPSC